MTTKTIVICDRCKKEMQPIKIVAPDFERCRHDFCPKCKKEYDSWMRIGKEK